MNTISETRIPDIYDILAKVRSGSDHVSSDTSQQVARTLNGIQTQPPSGLVGDMRRPPETITGKILNASI